MKTAAPMSAGPIEDQHGDDQPVDRDAFGEADQDQHAAEQFRLLGQRADRGAADHGNRIAGGERGKARGDRRRHHGPGRDRGIAAARSVRLARWPAPICSSRKVTPIAVTAARAPISARDLQVRSHHVPLRFGSGTVFLAITGGGSGLNSRPAPVRKRMKNSNSSRRVVWMLTTTPSSAMTSTLPSASTIQ